MILNTINVTLMLKLINVMLKLINVM